MVNMSTPNDSVVSVTKGRMTSGIRLVALINNTYASGGIL